MGLTINLFGAKVRVRTIQEPYKAEHISIAGAKTELEQSAPSPALNHIAQYQDLKAFQLDDNSKVGLNSSAGNSIRSVPTHTPENHFSR